MAKYWFQMIYFNCPICDKSRKVQFKIYGTKPKEEEKRRIFIELYDCCQEPEEK